MDCFFIIKLSGHFFSASHAMFYFFCLIFSIMFSCPHGCSLSPCCLGCTHNLSSSLSFWGSCFTLSCVFPYSVPPTAFPGFEFLTPALPLFCIFMLFFLKTSALTLFWVYVLCPKSCMLSLYPACHTGAYDRFLQVTNLQRNWRLFRKIKH